MRQAVTTMMVGLCLVFAMSARGAVDDPPGAGEPPIARARRLIQAGDRAAAVDLLEEALIDGPVGDRPAILDLLRRSYQAMAREAEAAGRAEAAAHYRDNLAILERSVTGDRPSPTPDQQGQPSRPAVRPSRPRVEPAPVPARSKATNTPGTAAALAPPAVAPPPSSVPPPSVSGPPELQSPTPESSLSEPTPLPEPAKLPKPGPVQQVASGAANPGMSRIPPAGARDDGTREIPNTSPMPGPALSGPDEPGGEAAFNPGAASQPAVNPGAANEAVVNPGAAGQPEAARIGTERAPAGSPGLAQADALFRSRRFDEAGRIYAALAARKRLPAESRPHWAYCRIVAVVRRINARPRTVREWDAIEAEVRDIQRLTPGNWYAEYLVNKVAEARRSRRRPAASSDGLVVRGSAPEDSSPQAQPQPEPPPQSNSQVPSRRRLFGRTRGTPAVPIQPGSPPDGPPAPGAASSSLVADANPVLNLPVNPSEPTAEAANPEAEISPAGGTSQDGTNDRSPSSQRGEVRVEGDADSTAPPPSSPTAPSSALRAPSPRAGEGDASAVSGQPSPNESGTAAWQVHETPNFRIYHTDPALAERAGAVAESVRTAQARRWGSAAAGGSWSPRCELYLYPTAEQYAEATGQPRRSPGISTLSTNEVRVLSRRMSLRADNPLLLTTTLPHEVTHVVLADLFVARPIPRWADEGLAVLAEPATERRHRQADLKEPLGGGRVFKVGQLMTMDYPAPEDWQLFYAQSVSLTQFLVEQGPPRRFIQFVRDSQRQGAEAALRDIYQIDGLAALQERWLTYARRQVAVDVASSRDGDAGSAEARRE